MTNEGQGSSVRTLGGTATCAAMHGERAVLAAAAQWMVDRLVNDWDEAELMKALVRMHGAWPGCAGCDGKCEEPCRAATVDEQLARVDHRMADLVHAGWLLAPEGYRPPAGWSPQPQGTRASGLARTVAPSRSAGQGAPS